VKTQQRERQWPNIYCVKCRSKREVHDGKLIATKNNKTRVAGLCPDGHKVSQFISNSMPKEE